MIDGRGETAEAEIVERAQPVDPLGDGECDEAPAARADATTSAAPGNRDAAGCDEDVEGRLGRGEVTTEEARGRGHDGEEENGYREPEDERQRGARTAIGQPPQSDERERRADDRAEGHAGGESVERLFRHGAAGRRAQAAALGLTS